MKRVYSLYTIKHKVSSLFMLMALLWLTVSIPFVYSFQQKMAIEKIATAQSAVDDNDSSDNPLNNTTEEKNGNSLNTLSEEYLHHAHEEFNHIAEIIAHLHHAHESTYIAFHGELLCPPPNA